MLSPGPGSGPFPAILTSAGRNHRVLRRRAWAQTLAEAIAATEDQIAATIGRLADQRPQHAERWRAMSESARRYAAREREWLARHPGARLKPLADRGGRRRTEPGDPRDRGHGLPGRAALARPHAQPGASWTSAGSWPPRQCPLQRPGRQRRICRGHCRTVGDLAAAPRAHRRTRHPLSVVITADSGLYSLTDEAASLSSDASAGAQAS
jgi:hypothetical protein